MATKIKLMRLGKKRAPYYRIVVADARNKRDGKVIETIGKYHPKEDPSFIEVDAERAAYWLGVGAQPTDPVERILKVTGDWQSFKGEAAPEPMKVREPRPDKRVAFEAASLGNTEGKGDATTPSKKKAPKADAAVDKAAADKPAADKAADKAAADKPASDKAAADKPASDKPASDKPASDKPASDKPAADTVEAVAAAEAPQAAVTPDAVAEAPADETATETPATETPATETPAESKAAE